MALTKAEREEILAEARAQAIAELKAERAASGTVDAQPLIPGVPELSIADVFRVLLHHSRISSQALVDQCLAAVDREFAEVDEPVADETTPESAPV